MSPSTARLAAGSMGSGTTREVGQAGAHSVVATANTHGPGLYEVYNDASASSSRTWGTLGPADGMVMVDPGSDTNFHPKRLRHAAGIVWGRVPVQAQGGGLGGEADNDDPIHHGARGQGWWEAHRHSHGPGHYHGLAPRPRSLGAPGPRRKISPRRASAATRRGRCTAGAAQLGAPWEDSGAVGQLKNPGIATGVRVVAEGNTPQPPISHQLVSPPLSQQQRTCSSKPRPTPAPRCECTTFRAAKNFTSWTSWGLHPRPCARSARAAETARSEGGG